MEQKINGEEPLLAAETVPAGTEVTDAGTATDNDDSGTVDTVEPEPAPAVDIEALIAEAEERGYKRGRNERIEELMQAPGTWETPAPAPAAPTDACNEVMILNSMRRSVWE